MSKRGGTWISLKWRLQTQEAICMQQLIWKHFGENLWKCYLNSQQQKIEQHRQLHGKTPESAIIKTLGRGRKFKNERYITSNSIFTKCDKGIFYTKRLCKGSMKKEKRSVAVKKLQQWKLLFKNNQVLKE